MTSWLCPREADRERLLDMDRRLRPLRRWSFGALAVALVAAGPWVGFWTLIPLVLASAAFSAAERVLPGLRRPEWALAGAWAFAQGSIAVSIVLTGGATSPAVAWLVLPVVTLGARFSTRGHVAGVGFTALLMVLATTVTTPGAVVAQPARLLFPLALLIGVALLTTALMRSDVQHRDDSVLDGLTGMLNRRALTHRAFELEQQSQLTGQPIGVVIGDIDRFKRINDEHGHAVGDTVLVDVAYTIRKELRAYDLAYRLGGEEFLVLLPGADGRQSAEVAERLRCAVAERPAGGQSVTMSFGVACSAAPFRVERLIADADAALYRAKAAGRDRVASADGAERSPALAGAL
jgi:diguanylate cyclase (GGDEF)-like protein